MYENSIGRRAFHQKSAMECIDDSPNASNPFLSLPPELHAHIFEYLGFPPTQYEIPSEFSTWAALERTCRAAQEITQPYLYYKIYTNVRTRGRTIELPWKTDPGKAETSNRVLSTLSLVNLLERRPRLQKMVHYLVLDEYDPMALRRLLRLRLERLESIICQHEGEVVPVLPTSLDDPDALVEKQSRLTNFTFSIHQNTSKAWPTYKLTLFDAPLMGHPSLTRIRLSYLDISCFEALHENYFTHSSLNELNLEYCQYSLPSLARLLRPAQNLTILYLHFDNDSPLTADEEAAFLPLVQSVCGTTLKILKLLWRNQKPKNEQWPGWDLTNFTALRFLHACPSFLFPPTTTSPTTEMMSQILPPRLKILVLDGLIPLHFPGRSMGLGLDLSQYDMELLVAMILFKGKGNVQSFRHLFVFYAEGLAGINQALVREAKKVGITLGFMEMEDQRHLDSVNLEWLDGEEVYGGNDGEEGEDEGEEEEAEEEAEDGDEGGEGNESEEDHDDENDENEDDDPNESDLEGHTQSV